MQVAWTRVLRHVSDGMSEYKYSERMYYHQVTKQCIIHDLYGLDTCVEACG